ncbi:hypothetical protein QBZ16_000573 [Prototheca wickerhamii]|uniref:STI1 domain-containing protein n=1 Tax=Prototheca wickerhamii TaxID=3111 RepID=A0AAD9ILF3_PROWI|nr:hypothetical protein QBZ16_000573 [Prototheca wickerhamii]
MSADELKAKGNAAFSAGKYDEAVEHFSAAIALDGGNHILYSNRSAAHASASRYAEALQDAEKGYSRLGAAHYGLRQYDEAAAAYRQGLELDPSNEQLKSGLEDAESARASARRGPPGGGLFSQPEVLSRLATNPTTRAYLSQPDFMEMMQAINRDPSAMQRYLGDDRFQTALQVGLGMNIVTPDQAAEMETEERAQAEAAKPEPKAEPSTAAREEPAAEEPAPEAPASTPESAPTPASDSPSKAAALAEKEAGNAAYKAKRFDEAIERYTRAIELDAGDISFLSNRAAAHFEKGDYAACVADCEEAVERGRAAHTDYKLIARAITRKGTALAKQGDLEGAIACFQKSLTEHRNADTLKRLHDAEKALREQQAAAYVDADLSAEAKEAGNAAFKRQDYPEAVRLYSEALKRGPPGVNPEAHKLYSNRAACYTKLGAWQEGLKDAEECIRLAPDFSKGYSRKGHLQFFMKEYSKARETYEAGLARDPDNAELREGLVRTVQALNRLTRGEGSEEERRQTQERALADPEIQAILTDPVMRQVLRDMEEDPAAAQKHLANAQIAAKFEKLVTAGIVQIR